MQQLVDTEINELNVNLTKGVVIPTIAGINVSDIELTCSDGWVEFGLNATPEFFEGVQAAWGFWKREVDNINAGMFETTPYFAYGETLFLQ